MWVGVLGVALRLRRRRRAVYLSRPALTPSPHSPPPPITTHCAHTRHHHHHHHQPTTATHIISGSDRTDVIGLILIKELLRFWRTDATPAAGDLRMRVLPRMPYDTAMFDMLNFFQVGG